VQFKITIDISDRLARILISDKLDYIIQQGEQIMSALDDLKAANELLTTNIQGGFEVVGAAMTELASDIAALGALDPAEVEAEAARVSAAATTIKDGLDTLAHTIKDAIATPPAV
jgi:hypothetical protein